MPIDSDLFGFALNLVVFTALINLAASLEVLSVSLNFSKRFQLPQFNLSYILIITTFDWCVHVADNFLFQLIFVFRLFQIH